MRRRMATLELLEGVSSVPRAAWNALVGDESPFLEWEWLASLEQAGCASGKSGWSAAAAGRARGRAPAGGGAALRQAAQRGRVRVRRRLGARPPSARGSRTTPSSLVGVPFTPVGGARFLVAPGEDRAAWVHRLGAALADSVPRERSLGRARLLLSRGRDRAAARGRLRAARSACSTTGATRATRASTTTWRASAASAATRSAASAARWRSRACASRSCAARPIADALVRADVPLLPLDRATSAPGAGST